MRSSSTHTPLLQWERTLQLALFLIILLCTWRAEWLVHQHDPFEFLRRGGDALGYYQWLPATFIDHDFSSMYWCYRIENGNAMSLFTIGVAVLQLPFFLLGHWAASAFGYPLNGFSSPYGVAMMFGAAFYSAAGCVLAFRLARIYSATVPAFIASILLYAATNLGYYCVYEPLMSHMYSFFLITLFAYCSVRVLQGPRPVHVFAMVLAGALALLVRQLNIFSLLFPLLVAGSFARIRDFFRTLFAHRSAMVLAMVAALLPWVLQLIYWYWTTGEVITFTYGKKDEHFEFDKMVPGRVLFSVRNGWLVYTPLMIAVLVVLIRKAWCRVAPAGTVLLLVTLTWLIYSAWWCWWLGTGFGHRGFVDLYGLLAIPLAWLVGGVQRRGIPWKISAVVVFCILIQLNIGLMGRFQWYWSTIDWTWQQFFQQVSDIVVNG